uniref:Uncharacterized protein n=1 Tax=Malurus cyaneus samueli TaxID=2593467 RepID=A0A8C5TUB8_9PASS
MERALRTALLAKALFPEGSSSSNEQGSGGCTPQDEELGQGLKRCSMGCKHRGLSFLSGSASRILPFWHL